MPTPATELTILGNGYCGSRLYANYDKAKVTSRTPTNDEQLYFKLDDQTSWLNIPPSKRILWTFACTNSPLENQFFGFLTQRCEQVFIYSTTSVYQHRFNGQIIDEMSAIDQTKSRAIAEENYRHQGACLLTLCGISGPDRSPANWLKKGRIKNANKEVNLIHVEDIVSITKILLRQELHGLRLNLAPGKTYSWRDIAHTVNYSFSSEALAQEASMKLIANTQLLKHLTKGYGFINPIH
tara:strand:- start:1203 stop:1919 length:717 start_codon:yes stop_codon:yes gene_type:complete